jgi:hypothetical protein
MEVLKKWLLSDRKEEVLNDTLVKEKFMRIKDKYENLSFRFIRENYPAGHQGVVKLRNNLLSDLELT